MIALVLLALQQAAAAPANSPWQQEVAYEISARLDEPAGVLSGGERIRYRNASPDTLTTFSLHLYLNAFRPGSRWADADSRATKDVINPATGVRIGTVPVMGADETRRGRP